MDSTIKLINKYDRTLVDVIQWLDSNGHSNTEIRSKVDVMLNFEKKIKRRIRNGANKKYLCRRLKKI